MKNKDKILIIIAFCIVIFLCYGLYSKYEKFASKIGTGSVDMVAGSSLYYCNFTNGGWRFTQDKNSSLKFDIYDDNTLIPIPDDSSTSCYQKDKGNNFKYSMPSSDRFNYGNYGKLGSALIRDPPPLTTQPLTTPPLTTPPLTTPPLTTPPLTTPPLTTLATTTTSHNNTQYLKNIQNKIDNGYSMLNNNRFTIMDNQLKLDSLNSRANKLLNNINKLNNFSNQNKIQTNELTFY